jgi:hypothetical protein
LEQGVNVWGNSREIAGYPRVGKGKRCQRWDDPGFPRSVVPGKLDSENSFHPDFAFPSVAVAKPFRLRAELATPLQKSRFWKIKITIDKSRFISVLKGARTGRTTYPRLPSPRNTSPTSALFFPRHASGALVETRVPSRGFQELLVWLAWLNLIAIFRYSWLMTDKWRRCMRHLGFPGRMGLRAGVSWIRDF